MQHPRGFVKRILLGAAAAAVGLALLSACADSTTAPIEGDREEPVADCEPELDLASTAFGPYTRTNLIPTIPPATVTPEEGYWGGPPHFQATIAENAFDPCAELSWVLLKGNTRNSPGVTDSAAVVFFHRDEMLTDPLPVQLAANTRVERLAGNTLKVIFGHYAAPGEMVTQELRSLTFTWDEDALNVDEIDWIREYSTTRTRLDLNAAPPVTDIPALPLGNIHHRPFGAEHELVDFPGSNVSIPLGDGARLTCILKFAEDQHNWGWIGCLGEEVDWDFVDPPFGTPPPPAPGMTDPAAGDGPREGANYLQITLLPAALSTTRVDPAALDHPVTHEIAEGMLTRIGHYVIDTRGDEVRLIYGSTAVAITADGFGIEPANLLERSRWRH